MHRSPRRRAARRRAFRSPFLAVTFTLFALFSLAVLAGCGRPAATTAPFAASAATSLTTTDAAHAPAAAVVPEAADDGHFVDLSVGSTAKMAEDFAVRLTFDGDPTGGEWEHREQSITRTIPGTQEQDGATYALVRQVVVEAEGVGEQTDLFREDRTGLYCWQPDLPGAEIANGAPRPSWAATLEAALERQAAVRLAAAADRAAAQRTAATLVGRVLAVRSAALTNLATLRAVGGARGGVTPHEITFLRYPFRPGASWDGRMGFNVWTFEAREPLALAGRRFASARLHIVPVQFGPDDHYQVWYASPGEVAHHGHFVDPVVNDAGTVIGTMEIEDTAQLVGWEPAARH